MRRKKQSGWRTFLISVTVLAAISYIGYQGFRGIFSSIETEMAISHRVYESIDARGLVYRSETVIPAAESGHVYFSVENGTRVAKKNMIAAVYSDANSGHIEQEIADIDLQIESLNALQADAGSNRLTLSMIKTQTENALFRMIQDTESGNFGNVSTTKFDVLSLLSKEQLIIGKTVDFSDKIKELKKERKALKSAYRAPKSKIYAPVAGYFADRTDGYEANLDTDYLKGLSVKELSKQMEKTPKTDDSLCGKIVSGYEWYMACVLPDRYYNELGVGKTLSLRMSFVLDEAIPATVYACNKDNNGQIAVVFRCDYMSAELSTIRKEAVQIQLEEHIGLKVPKRAIVIDDEQQAGVYVRVGNIASFRKIKQLYSEAADYVICEPVENDDTYLRLYDDIIVGGRGLYDGKIVG